ncbi:MAG: response regulator transcription factor [Spirochaeta sp.]|jgi:DNA-binding NarL/FixJ family response regulator|nr:response regulator transcription factor [Spirochaeta sp.]
MTRVLLVDDQRLFVESLKRLLEFDSSDISVCGVAYDAESALTLLSQTHPDVVLLDVRMPGSDGVEVARIINRDWPDIHTVMLTTFDDDEYVHNALIQGAAGYLLKDIPPEELIAAIRAVKEGGVTMSPSIARKLAQGHVVGEPNEEMKLLEDLTPRDEELLSLLAQGHNNSEIATKLFLGPQTVRNYVSSLYAKLGVRNRAEAMRFGRRLLSSRLR